MYLALCQPKKNKFIKTNNREINHVYNANLNNYRRCGKNTASNTITFNFSEAIRNGSFSVDDIRISNGTINAGSFTKISDTQYTIVVTPSLGGQHSNVAITVLANTFVDIVGNTNTAIAKNTTKISDLKDQVDIDGSGFDVCFNELECIPCK
ncbi:Chitinase (EC [uncultured Gammaproteobacteria bacterium]|nr:Chitinase (EC [uncultured Gammaproteobacteria bacterium]